MLELFEPLLWMTACWACGIFTGLGLGTAIASQRFALARCRDDD